MQIVRNVVHKKLRTSDQVMKGKTFYSAVLARERDDMLRLRMLRLEQPDSVAKAFHKLKYEMIVS